jgi:transposase
VRVSIGGTVYDPTDPMGKMFFHRQRAHVIKLVQAGDHTIAEVAELFAVSRATIYREFARARPPQTVR